MRTEYMKRNTIKKFQTNLIIITVSLLLAIFFLILGFCIPDGNKWGDFAINISASFLTVGATVILVDMLRSRHQKISYSIPQQQAVTRISQIHTVLFMTILTKVLKKDKRFISEFVNVGNGLPNEDYADALSSFLIKYIKEIQTIENSRIFAGYSKDDYRYLKEQLIKTQVDLESAVRRYDFSFLDVQFNTDLAQVSDRLEHLIGAFIVESFNSADLNQILTVESTPENAFDIYMSGVLKQYLEVLVGFLETYKK